MDRDQGPDSSAMQKAAQQIKRGNLSQRQAAQRLGISRQALQRWLKRQGVQTPRRPRKMQLHAASGQAFIEVRGRREYLGKYGSKTAEKRYHARLSELAREAEEAQRTEAPVAAEAGTAADGIVDTATPRAAGDDAVLTREQMEALLDQCRRRGEALTVNGLLMCFWQYQRRQYSLRAERGASTAHLANWGLTAELIADHVGDRLVRDVGPEAILAIQETLIERDCCVNYINKLTGYVKHVFRWGMTRRLVDRLVAFDVSSVPSLKAGMTAARVTAETEAVADAWVEAVLPYLSPPVRAMVQVQRLTGMRSDNVTAIRGCDLNMSGQIWTYEPARHKTSHRGYRLRIAIGPKAQAIIRPFLRTNLTEYLFQPADAVEWHRATRAAARKSKRTPSQLARQPKASPERPQRDRYDSKSYYRSVAYGIDRANRARRAELAKRLGREPTSDEAANFQIPAWYPHQLRHALISEVRKRFGLDVAQVAAAHRDQTTTERYSRAALTEEHAERVAREIG